MLISAPWLPSCPLRGIPPGNFLILGPKAHLFIQPLAFDTAMLPDPLQHFTRIQRRPGREILSWKTKQRCQLVFSTPVGIKYSAEEKKSKFGLAPISVKIVKLDTSVAESGFYTYEEFFLGHAREAGSFF